MKRIINYSTLLLFACLINISIFSDAIRKNFYKSITNWTNYEISIISNEKLPRIDSNFDSQFPSDGIAYNLGEARDKAFRKAQKSNRKKMSYALERITLNENFTIGEYLEVNPSIKSKFIRYFNSNPELEIIEYKQNQIQLTSNLLLLGSGNLMSLFYSELGGDDIPLPEESLPGEDYTGFIIDARGTDFQPSLFPKIQNEDGRDIFNRYVANPASIQEIGMVYYSDIESSAKIRNRTGKNPYFGVPIGIAGKNKTMLVLADQEIQKILNSPISRKNLKYCKIVILLDAQAL